MVIFIRTEYMCDVCNFKFEPVLIDIINNHRHPKECPNCHSTEWNRENRTYSVE